ncbi:hypothetical protein STANM309S_00767 [Streptomyces tanashiensis]
MTGAGAAQSSLRAARRRSYSWMIAFAWPYASSCAPRSQPTRSSKRTRRALLDGPHPVGDLTTGAARDAGQQVAVGLFGEACDIGASAACALLFLPDTVPKPAPVGNQAAEALGARGGRG